MIYAISDIHACYEAFQQRIEQLKPKLEEGDNKLILLGDYIDRGTDSYKVLELIHSLQKKFGKEKVIALKGNHEEWFLDFLENGERIWLEEDKDYHTSKTFLLKEQKKTLEKMTSKEEATKYLCSCIKKNHKSLIHWIKNLPYYYETPTQIFVHAGVEEDILEEELEWCTLMTPEYVMTGKYPATLGKFFKDIIAGHIGVSEIAQDETYQGIYFDGESHYYIDGSVEKTGELLCLAYDEKNQKYYELDREGNYKEIIKN